MAEGTTGPGRNELENPGSNAFLNDVENAGIEPQQESSSSRNRRRKTYEGRDEQESASLPQERKPRTDYEHLTIVLDDKLKTFPYQSVGRLDYTKVNRYGTRHPSHSTAWVVHALGYHIVITAAHCLKKYDEKAMNIRFTPGFDPHSRELLTYNQIVGGEGKAWAVHPGWDPYECPAEYDIGIVHLAKGPDNRFVDDVVTPIRLLSNLSYDSDSKFKTIGCPKPSRENPDGKMCEQEGTFYRMSRSGPSFYNYGKLPKAVSGGPMIISDSDNSYGCGGIMVGNVHKYGCVQSPYFNFTIDELIKLLFYQ